MQSPEHIRPTPTPPLSVLTPREREVAALVAEGLSNAEIAERLVLSPGTVANHLAHVMGKLGARSRVHVAVWSVRQEYADLGRREN